jgi:mRNA-degrading endonuclease RelE of RelBE toxin-antitoxin system
MTNVGSDLLTAEGLERPAGSVVLSEQAKADLEGLSRPTRALLSRTMRDQLLEPWRWQDFKFKAVKTSGEHAWYELGVGKFRVMFTPIRHGAGASMSEDRYVGRIVRAEQVPGALQTLDNPAPL